MPRCGGSKPTGDPCERIVPASQDYCYSHDPDRVDERRRAASKAGESKPNREVVDLRRRLSELTVGVLDGIVDKGVSAVASQILNVYLRAVSVELKVKEVEELEGRIEELSEAFERQREVRRRGAQGQARQAAEGHAREYGVLCSFGMARESTSTRKRRGRPHSGTARNLCMQTTYASLGPNLRPSLRS